MLRAAEGGCWCSHACVVPLFYCPVASALNSRRMLQLRLSLAVLVRRRLEWKRPNGIHGHCIDITCPTQIITGASGFGAWDIMISHSECLRRKLAIQKPALEAPAVGF